MGSHFMPDADTLEIAALRAENESLLAENASLRAWAKDDTLDDVLACRARIAELEAIVATIPDQRENAVYAALTMFSTHLCGNALGDEARNTARSFREPTP